MAVNTQMSNAAVTAEGNALAALCNSGYIKIMSGTQPANANTAVSSQTVLAVLRFGATAFTNNNGVLTANAITSDSNAPASGTATWFRVYQSDNATVVFDGSVGTANANMVLAATTISAGQTVSCSSFVHTLAEATAGL